MDLYTEIGVNKLKLSPAPLVAQGIACWPANHVPRVQIPGLPVCSKSLYKLIYELCWIASDEIYIKKYFGHLGPYI